MFLTEVDLKKVTSFSEHIKESDKKVTTRFLSEFWGASALSRIFLHALPVIIHAAFVSIYLDL